MFVVLHVNFHFAGIVYRTGIRVVNMDVIIKNTSGIIKEILYSTKQYSGASWIILTKERVLLDMAVLIYPLTAKLFNLNFHSLEGGGPRVVVSTAAFHARVRGSFLGLRPPGLEFRILCLEDSVISFIS